MNLMRLVLSLVLVGFLALTLVVVAQHGYVGFFELATANWATRLLSLDLVISLSLVAAWMVRDARARGAAFVPYLLVTATFGAAGPLLYLIWRKPAAA